MLCPSVNRPLEDPSPPSAAELRSPRALKTGWRPACKAPRCPGTQMRSPQCWSWLKAVPCLASTRCWSPNASPRPPVCLVPEARLGSGEGAQSPVGLEPGALLDDATTGAVTIQQEFVCTSAPHIALPIEAPHQDEEVSAWFQPPLLLPAGWLTRTQSDSPPLQHGPIQGPWPRAPTPSPERNAPGPYSNLSFNLWEPFPNSPLQTLLLSPQPQSRFSCAPPLVARSGTCSQCQEMPVLGMNGMQSLLKGLRTRRRDSNSCCEFTTHLKTMNKDRCSFDPGSLQNC